MEKEIGAFIAYLHNVKNTSENTEMSYKRDLEKVSHFLESRGIRETKDVKAQDLADYVKFLENSKFAAATVSRNIASLKAFYHLSLFHISEPTRQAEISFAGFCLKKKKNSTL